MRACLLSLWLVCGLLFAGGAFAQAAAEKTPAVAELGVADLISQDEADRLWRYYTRDSDAVREEFQIALNAAHGDFTDPQLAAAVARMTAVDEAVHPAIAKLIRNGYWQREGRNATFDQAVWLALQHIFDPELVELTLAQIRPLVAKGEMPGQSYALMYDRNEVRRGRPQFYGSQFVCKDGQAAAQPLLDPEHVDERRREMGIPMSFADYIALMQQQCAM